MRPRPQAAILLAIAMAGCSGRVAPAARQGASPDYAALASRAVRVLEQRYYTGSGTWRMCVPAICRSKNFDWGADSLTGTLFLHWQLTGDPRVRPVMAALTATARQYGPAAGQWSDVPMWDAVADLREYQVTGDRAALVKAEVAFAQVDVVGAAGFATGACPSIDYQARNGSDKLKTLETDANYIKAAILLYQATRVRSYLAKAEQKYAAVRTYFLGRAGLYTVYVFDTGSRCDRLPGRYYASVNGLMIWSGATLAGLTGNRGYLAEAITTARAVRRYLSDASGVYADLQAENDVAEPLVEAMYLLATADHQRFARQWLLTCASAAASAVSTTGAYGRFFDGPPPRAPVTAWQANGGIALMIVAARLDPHGVPAGRYSWRRAVFVTDNRRLPAGGGSVRVAFTGSAIAITGTLGERCCQAGHATVSVDGRPTVDRTGIWQDKSSSARRIPGTILFAWRWPAAGRHVITIGPAPSNAKEGGPFFHMTGYYLIR